MSYLRNTFESVAKAEASTAEGSAPLAGSTGATPIVANVSRVDDLLSAFTKEEITVEGDFNARLKAVVGDDAGASFADIILAAATSSTAGDDSRGLTGFKRIREAEIDAMRLNQVLQFATSRYPPESEEISNLRKKVQDLSLEYRGLVLYTFRVVCAQVARFDDQYRHRFLWGPICEATGRTTNDMLDEIVDPFEFQRHKGMAIANRLAALHVASRYLLRQHRLYHRAPQRQFTIHKKPDPVTGVTTRQVEVTVVPELDPHRSTAIDVYQAARNDASAAQCASEGVPFEVEVVRVPVMACLDPFATAGSTLNALEAARAASRTAVVAQLQQMEEMGDVIVPGAITDSIALSTVSSVPAPSAIPSQPRAHSATFERINTDYTAHSELILSAYFPDVCGLHEASDVSAVNAVILGPAMTYVYELVPGMIPLAQLVGQCGKFVESQPLFRHIASELLRAFVDIENQCTFDIAPGGITIENVYVSDQGTRLTLRGVTWRQPCAAFNPLDARALLRRRSARLMRCYGTIIRQILAQPSSAPPTELPAVCAALPSICSIAQQGMRTFTRMQVEHGFSVVALEVFEVLLPLVRQLPTNRSTKSSVVGKSAGLVPTLSQADAENITAGFMWIIEAGQSAVSSQTAAVRLLDSRNELVPVGVVTGHQSTSASVVSGGSALKRSPSRSKLSVAGSHEGRSLTSAQSNAQLLVPVTRLLFVAEAAGELSLWFKRSKLSDHTVDLLEEDERDDASSVPGSVSHTAPRSRTTTSFHILSVIRVYDSTVSTTIRLVLDSALPPMRTHPAFTALCATAELLGASESLETHPTARAPAVFGMKWWENAWMLRIVRQLGLMFSLPGHEELVAGAEVTQADIQVFKALLELFFPQGLEAFGHLTLGEDYESMRVEAQSEWEVGGKDGKEGEAPTSVNDFRAQVRKGLTSGPPNLISSVSQLIHHPYFSTWGMDHEEQCALVQDDFAAHSFPLVHR